jgi:hypothetical protein
MANGQILHDSEARGGEKVQRIVFKKMVNLLSDGQILSEGKTKSGSKTERTR